MFQRHRIKILQRRTNNRKNSLLSIGDKGEVGTEGCPRMEINGRS